MGGALALSMTPRSESSLLERYPTKDQDPLFLPELPKDPHPTNRESGDHSAVGHCQEAVTTGESCPGGIKGVPLEGYYTFTFSTEQFLRPQRKQARGTDVTGNKTSLLPRRSPDFILSGEMEPQTNRFCLAVETAPQVSLRGICCPYPRLSVKHLPIQLGLLSKKKKILDYVQNTCYILGGLCQMVKVSVQKKNKVFWTMFRTLVI